MNTTKGNWINRRPFTIGCIAAPIVSLALVLVVLSLIDPWSPLCNEDQYYDLNSGRHRIVKHLLFVKVSDKVEEGVLAKLYLKHFEAFPAPEWVIVNTFSLQSPTVSPHYRYHGIFSNERNLSLCMEQAAVSDEFEKLLVAYLLWSAKVAGGDYYPKAIGDVFYSAINEKGNRHQLEAKDFPVDSAFVSLTGKPIYENPRLTPRAYGLDRFPELMQKIPPPY